MRVRTDRFVTHTMMTLSLLAALALGWFVSRTEGIDSNDSRAMVFAIVAVWGALELVTIVLHSLRYGIDALSLSMGTARLAIINYFAALALNMGALILVPNWYFSGSRVALAVACGSAAAYLGREAMWAFQDLTKVGRFVMAATLMLLAGAIAVLILTF